MRIAITTTHPGPYTDILFNGIANVHELDVIYHRRNNSEKPWKAEDFYSGCDGSSLTFISFIRRLLASEIVILWGYNSVRNMLAAIICVLLKRKVGIFMDHPDPARMRVWKSLIKILLFKFPIHLLGASRSCVNFMQGMIRVPDARCHVFPYPIASVDLNQVQWNDLRNAELVAGAKIRILIANRFIERKNYKVILDAFRVISKTGCLDRFEVTIVGNGPQYDEYSTAFSSLIGEIKMLGWVENSDYVELIKCTDVFIHASAFEPFGIPPVDALEHGKLVVISDGIKSLSGMIDNGVNGFEFPSEDVSMLVDILTSVAKSPAQIYDIGAQGKALAEGYHVSANLTAIERLI